MYIRIFNIQITHENSEILKKGTLCKSCKDNSTNNLTLNKHQQNSNNKTSDSTHEYFGSNMYIHRT